jgi:hypothetical protein
VVVPETGETSSGQQVAVRVGVGGGVALGVGDGCEVVLDVERVCRHGRSPARPGLGEGEEAIERVVGVRGAGRVRAARPVGVPDLGQVAVAVEGVVGDGFLGRAGGLDDPVEMAAGRVDEIGGGGGLPGGAVPGLELFADAVAGGVEGEEGSLGRGGGVGLALDGDEPSGGVVAVGDDVAAREDGAEEIAEFGVDVLGGEILGRRLALLGDPGDAGELVVLGLGGHAVGVGHRGAAVQGVVAEGGGADERVGPGERNQVPRAES